MSGTTSFAIGSALLVIVSLGFLLWPFRRRSAKADLSRQQLNTAIYRDQMAEVERDRADGSLSQADYDQARAELQRRLLEDSQASDPKAGKFAPSRVVPTAMAFILPLGAILLYLVLGNPAALNPASSGAGSPHNQQMSRQDIEKMVADFAAKLENEPENYQGWAMLGRSYKSMGRFPEAIRAYERTGPMLETSADLLVDYADTMAAASGFDKKVMATIDRALKLDPKQPQALWLRGTAAFEAKQYAKAVADWEVLLALFPDDSEEAGAIRANLAEARQLGGLKASAQPATKVGAGGTASSPRAAAAGGTIKGRVELAGTLSGKLPDGAVLMVVARPNDGSRMPVAVVRANAAELPFNFTLDDSLAMSPDRKLSQFPELLVEARISKTGQATPQAGDLFGPAVPAKLGTHNLALKIDQVRQ